MKLIFLASGFKIPRLLSLYKLKFASLEVFMAELLRTFSLLQGHDTASVGNQFLVFQKNIVPSSSQA